LTGIKGILLVHWEVVHWDKHSLSIRYHWDRHFPFTFPLYRAGVEWPQIAGRQKQITITAVDDW